MKFLLIILLSFSTFADTEFAYPTESINAEFSDLEAIESYISQNESSLIELQAEHPELLKNVNLSETQNNLKFAGEPMPLVGPFWWGCCLGIIGLALVYFITDNDKEQLKDALIGCIIGTLFFGSILAILNPF